MSDQIKVLNVGQGLIQASKDILPGKGVTLDAKEAEGLMRMYPKYIVNAEKYMGMKIDDSQEIQDLKAKVEKLGAKLKASALDVDTQKVLAKNLELEDKVKKLEDENKNLTEELEKATAPVLPGVSGGEGKNRNRNR